MMADRRRGQVGTW